MCRTGARVVATTLLVVVCVGISVAEDSALPAIAFTNKAVPVQPGGNQGEIETSATWNDCVGVSKVEFTIWETVCGKDVVLKTETETITQAGGTKTHTFKKLVSGKVVTKAQARIIDVCNMEIVTTGKVNANAKVP